MSENYEVFEVDKSHLYENIRKYGKKELPTKKNNYLPNILFCLLFIGLISIGIITLQREYAKDSSLLLPLQSKSKLLGLSSDTRILIPDEKKVELQKWPVVACDQYTSEPEYWEKAKNIVGDKPSTLKIIYPEVYLNEEKSKKQERIKNICSTMKEYKENKVFKEVDGPIFVERTVSGKTHLGLVTTINLDDYVFTQNANTLIRPTEQTIVERLPPRMDIRRDAIIESPHILLLMDDMEKTVLEPLKNKKDKMTKIYDTDLMLDGGKIVGYTLSEDLKKEVIQKIQNLAKEEIQKKKYGDKVKGHPLLFAVGDGNHSLATAKSIWEERKKKGEDPEKSPGRLALVEIQNVHDDALTFEPIHRVFDGPNANKVLELLKKEFTGNFSFKKYDNPNDALKSILANGNKHPHTFAYISKEISGTFSINNSDKDLVVASIQPAIDKIVKENKIGIDYVHGEDIVIKLGLQDGHSSIMLPPMQKSELFKTVVSAGLVPRKTFSMGHAHEKRFYMECREIA